jgi:hypothetical protein
LLSDLMQHVLADPARIYSHEWAVGDTLIWDNRALLHRACAYNYAEPRVLIGTRIRGDETSELAYYPDAPEAALGRAALLEEMEALRAERAA